MYSSWILFSIRYRAIIVMFLKFKEVVKWDGLLCRNTVRAMHSRYWIDRIFIKNSSVYNFTSKCKPAVFTICFWEKSSFKFRVWNQSNYGPTCIVTDIYDHLKPFLYIIWKCLSKCNCIYESTWAQYLKFFVCC